MTMGNFPLASLQVKSFKILSKSNIKTLHMLLNDSFLEHVLNEENEYISVRKLAGEDTLRLFALQASKGDRKIDLDEEFMESLFQIAEQIFVKFPEIEGGDDLSSTIDEDLPQIDPREVDRETIENQWPLIRKQLTRKVVDYLDEDFPVIIDMFQAGSITFGLQLEDKEENLEAAMEFFVETEEYEKAADVRDKLAEIRE